MHNVKSLEIDLIKHLGVWIFVKIAKLIFLRFLLASWFNKASNIMEEINA